MDSLPSELLSTQQHYDWGLRALKTVLRGCGDLLAAARQSESITAERETALVVQALRLNTLSKLTSDDARRFDALIHDVFGADVNLTNVTQEQLAAAIRKVAVEEFGLAAVHDSQMKKCMELHEQLRQRMGVVLVGPSGVGKTTLWRMLRAALMQSGKQVTLYTVNPKSMPRQRVGAQ